MKHLTPGVIKLVFFIIALSLFFYIADPIKLYNFLGEQDAYIVVNSILILIISYLIYAVRWAILVCFSARSSNFLKFFISYLESLFYSSFTPSNLGGDAYRVLSNSSLHIKKSEIFAYILVERLVGLIIFLMFSLIIFNKIMDLFLVDLKIVILIFLSILFLIIIFNLDNFKLQIKNLLVRFGFIEDSLKALKKVLKDIKLVCVLSFISILGIFISVFAMQNLLEFNSLNISFINILGIFCAIEIIRIIPITYQGFGFRESFFAIMVTSLSTISFNEAIYLSGFYYLLVSFTLALTGFSVFIFNNIINSIKLILKK